MVVEDVLVVVEDVAGAAEVVVVEDVVLGDSDVPGSSDGTEEATEVVVVEDVALVLLDELAPLVVVGVAAVTAGSDASSSPNTDGEPCSSATLSAAAAVVVAASGCMVVTVTPPAPAAIVAGLLSLLDEQATASRAIIKNAAVDAGFEVEIANLLL